MQDPHWGHNLRNHGSGRLRRRRNGRTTPARATLLQHLHHDVALLRVKAAKLVLDVEPSLTAKVDQVLGLNVELARQCIDADFLLQAVLLYTRSPILSDEP
jgi:hypothetical protein